VQTAKTNDAGTEQRRSMQVVEPRRKGKDEIGPRERVFCVTAIYRIASEDRSIAKVLHASAAVPTRSVNAANPRDSNADASRQLRGGAFHDVTDDLVPGNQVLPPQRKFALHNVQVGAANPASSHLQQDMAWLQRGTHNFLYPKRTLGNILGFGKDRGNHGKLRSKVGCIGCALVFVQPKLSAQQFVLPRLFDLLNLLGVGIYDFQDRRLKIL
jgi:hypothetical protein